MSICRLCLISGRVQGVFYRASAEERARGLDVTGYAKNLPDGRVEVLACGEEMAVKEFCDWLGRGPPNARVTGVDMQDVDPAQTPKGFSTR